MMNLAGHQNSNHRYLRTFVGAVAVVAQAVQNLRMARSFVVALQELQVLYLATFSKAMISLNETE
jgi:hypothetical protein